jgi:polar amino acid transport system substrate-binding protein
MLKRIVEKIKVISLVMMSLISIDSYSKEKPFKFACSYFPPFKIEEKGDHMGIDVDIISEVFKELKVDVSYSFLPWKRALYSVKNGELDALCGCSYLKSREKYFYYTNEVGKNSVGIFTLKSNQDTYKNIDDLKELSIAVVRGYSLENELISKRIKVVPANNESQLIRLLQSNRVDAIYSFKTPILYILNKEKINNDLSFTEFRSSSYYSCFNKNRPSNKELVKRFNSKLKRIKLDGSYNKIIQKYLGK